ncbi:hypothetical protein X738_30395 [Mesorhizobium sp. LNHC209A00]|nr:hypothetical protein X738_30395 [Mesorhizobium sp. LNHC209A00]
MPTTRTILSSPSAHLAREHAGGSKGSRLPLATTGQANSLCRILPNAASALQPARLAVTVSLAARCGSGRTLAMQIGIVQHRAGEFRRRQKWASARFAASAS